MGRQHTENTNPEGEETDRRRKERNGHKKATQETLGGTPYKIRTRVLHGVLNHRVYAFYGGNLLDKLHFRHRKHWRRHALMDLQPMKTFTSSFIYENQRGPEHKAWSLFSII